MFLLLLPPDQVVVQGITLAVPYSGTSDINICHILIAHRTLYADLLLGWRWVGQVNRL
jgi:hypothetical protein